MAQFRATISGQRGSETSRIGNKTSGITTNTNGWNSGVRVVGGVNEDGDDQFTIYATRGSSPHRESVYIGYVNHAGEFHPAGIDANAD